MGHFREGTALGPKALCPAKVGQCNQGQVCAGGEQKPSQSWKAESQRQICATPQGICAGSALGPAEALVLVLRRLPLACWPLPHAAPDTLGTGAGGSGGGQEGAQAACSTR